MHSKLPVTHVNIRRLIEPSGNPSPFYANLSRLGPLYWDQETKLWICTGYREAEMILRDPQVRFSPYRLRSNDQLQAQGLDKLIPIYTLLRAQMAFQDDPRQSHLRACVQQHFMGTDWPRAMQMLVDEQLASCIQSPYHSQMDLLDFAGPLPTKGAALFLGLPLCDLPHFVHWNRIYTEALARLVGPAPLRLPLKKVDALLEPLEEATQYFQRLALARLRDPQNDLVSDLLHGLMQDQHTSTEVALNTVAAICLFLLAGGYATTTNLIIQALAWLWKNPDQCDLLEKEPGLFDAVIQETTRLSSSHQYEIWQALQDSIIGGRRIRRGETIVVLLAAANRDERFFHRAQEFLLSRPKFSLEHHFHSEAPYTDLLARIAVQTFLHSFPEFQLIEPVETALEWQGPPNARCPLHVPVLLGASLAAQNDIVYDAPSVKTLPPSYERGNEHRKNDTIVVSTDDDGVTTIHFDANQAELTLDLQQGIIHIAPKASAPGKDITRNTLEGQTDKLIHEAIQPVIIKQRIQQVFAMVVGIPADQVNEDCDFFEAGGDSLTIASLLLAIKQHFQVELDPAMIYDHPQLGELTDLITQEIREQEGVYV